MQFDHIERVWVPRRSLLLAALALGCLCAGALSGTAGRAGAQAGTHFGLNASGTGVSCDRPVDPSQCDIPAGGAFTLVVEFIAPPADGYVAIQAQVYVDGFTWNPASVEQENTWPDNQLPVRSPQTPGTGITVITYGGVSSISQPFTPSHHEGSVVELGLNCPAAPHAGDVALVAYTPEFSLGTVYNLADLSIVPAATIGTAEIDVDADGAAQRVPISNVLTIRCGGVQAPPEETLPGYTPGATVEPGLTPGATSEPGTTGTPPEDTTPGTSGRPTATPGAVNGDDDGDGGAPWAIIGVIVGVVIIAGAGGGYLWYLRRSRSA